MAVAFSSLAIAAGAAGLTTVASAPASAAVVTGGDAGGANFGEDFVIEDADFFLNEEDDPNPHVGKH